MSQGSNPLAAALGNILKRRNSLKGSKSPKSPKKSTSDSPRSTPKVKKKDSVGTPDSASVSRGFFGSLRRSGSRSSGRKKSKIGSISATASANVSTEDLRTDTSSVISMPVGPSSPRPSDEPIVTSTPVKPTEKREAVSPPQHSSIGSTNLKDRSYMSPIRDGPRDSAIFREPSVERLFESDSSNLFGSSELEAFFRKEKERTPERSIPESKETDSKKPEAPLASEVQDKSPVMRGGNESKSNIRSRLHAYERGSTSDSNAQSPPPIKEGKKDEHLDAGKKEVKTEPADKGKTSEKKDDVPKESKPLPKTSERKDDVPKESKPLPTKTNKDKKADNFKKEPAKKSNLFDDLEGDDDLFGPSKKQTSPSKSSNTVQSDLAKKKASLFEDELFQDDKVEPKPPVAKKEPPKIMPKKPRKSVDSSPKRETNKSDSPKTKTVERPAPTETKLEEIKEKTKAEAPKKEEKKAATVSSSFFDDGSDLPVYGLRKKSRVTQTETETKKEPIIEQVPKTEESARKKSSSLFDDDESDLPRYGLRRKKRGGLFDKDDDENVSPPRSGQRRQTQKQVEEIDSPASSLFADIDTETPSSPKADTKGSKVTATTEDKTQIELESEKREKEKEASKEARSKSPDLFDQDDIKDTVTKDTITKDLVSKDTFSTETADKSPSINIKEPTPENDADEETVEPPKETVSSVKTEKPATTRDRSATELGTSATGRGVKSAADKKTDKPKPSWMTDLKKKGEKSASTEAAAKKTTTTTTTKPTAEDEDVPDWQKRVLERRKNRAAEKKKETASPRAGRLSATKTESTASTRSTARSKSPSTSRKSPVTDRKSSRTEQKSTTTDKKPRSDRDKEFSKSVDVTSSRRTATSKTSPTKDEKRTKPAEDADAKKPKLATKPNIEVTKRITVSSSKSPRGSTTSPEPVGKDTKRTEGDDEVFTEDKTAVEKGVRDKTPSPKLSVDLISSVLDKDDVDASSETVAKENSTKGKGTACTYAIVCVYKKQIECVLECVLSLYMYC